MSRTELAEQIAALAAAGVAAQDLPSMLAALPVPLTALAAVGLSLWRKCPKRNCEWAVQSVLDSL